MLLVNIYYYYYLSHNSYNYINNIFSCRSLINLMAKPNKEHKLTDREKQVLSLLIDGYSNDEAAELLKLSRRTIEAHRSRIMLKTDLHDLPSLVKFGIKTGLTSVDTHRTKDNP